MSAVPPPQDVDTSKRFTFNGEQPAVSTLAEPPCWAIRCGEEWATGRNANDVLTTDRQWSRRKLWQSKARAMAEMWALRANGRSSVKCIRVTRRTRSR